MPDSHTMGLISGSTLFVLITIQVLTGAKLIKVSFKVHKIMGYVILGLAFMHGLGNIIN